MTCPLCQSQKNILFCQDKRREYYQCDDCRLVFVPEQFILTPEEEKAEYDKHENAIDDLGYRRFLSRLFDPLKERLQPGACGLDFGCGPGPALATMFQEAGFEMSVYDPFYANNSQVLNKKYDFITSTEVIEHVKNPAEVIPSLLKMLNSGGTIGFMTKQVLNKAAFANWHYKNDRTHIRFYSRDTFMFIADKFNLKVEFIGNDVIILKAKKLKRETCPNCERPQAVCLCPYLTKIENDYPVCILRHKSEKKHALNTVQILEKSLTDIVVFDGENFDEHAEFQQFLSDNCDKQFYMLYPDENAVQVEALKKENPKDLAFIILDGTWRKTRLIKYLTRSLDDIPAAALPMDVKSQYILRKGPEGGVSTLEATAILLQQLEGNSAKYQPLYDAFKQMIDMQIERMGRETFEKNYRVRI